MRREGEAYVRREWDTLRWDGSWTRYYVYAFLLRDDMAVQFGE
jgi:hypothetical protein